MSINAHFDMYPGCSDAGGAVPARKQRGRSWGSEGKGRGPTGSPHAGGHPPWRGGSMEPSRRDGQRRPDKSPCLKTAEAVEVTVRLCEHLLRAGHVPEPT